MKDKIKKDFIKGKITISNKGFGFISNENGNDIFVPSHQAIKAFNGETVHAKIIDKNGKKEAIIEKISNRKTDIIGQIIEKNNQFFIQESSNQIVEIKNYEGSIGDIIKAKIFKYPSYNTKAAAEFKDYIGNKTTKNIETKIIIQEHNIRNIFDKDQNNQANNISKKISFENRFDLTNLNFFTIDGESSRDFDDAIYCEKNENSYILYVAIADVSHYIKKDSFLDKEAYQRGNSVYFPNEVIPMLPEVLSNDLCSLKPKINRYAVVVKMIIDNKGIINDFKFMNAVINSKERLTYDIVSDLIDNSFENSKYKKIEKELKALKDLYEILKISREKRGSLDFDKKEQNIIFKDDEMIDMNLSERKISHKMVEEAMLCANISAARLIKNLKIESLYRVHEKPVEKLFDKISSFLIKIGFNKIQKNKKTLLLKKATYENFNGGHFGLAYNEYTHFTSPIRRYADLIVHRSIKHAISSELDYKYCLRPNNENISKEEYDYTKEELKAIAMHISETENIANKATNEANKILKCKFLETKIDQKFKGVLGKFTKNFIFVEFNDIIISGVLNYIDLPNNIKYEKEINTLKNTDNNKVYKEGDQIEFKILKIVNEKIYLSL